MHDDTSNNATARLHPARKALKERLVSTCGHCAENGCIDCTCKKSDPRLLLKPRIHGSGAGLQSERSPSNLELGFAQGRAQMKDPELVRIVSRANVGELGRRESLPLTIQVNGQIIAGELIGVKEFVAILKSERRHSAGALSPSDPNVEFLHMRRARVTNELVAQEWPQESGSMYRCKIDAVVSFIVP